MFNPGDKVLVYSAAWDKRPVISTIERVTKTQVILSGGGRYNIRDGFAVPYSVGAGHIEHATDDQITAVRQRDRTARQRKAIGEYVSKATPGEIEWLYGALRERGMLTDPAAQG